MKRKAEDDGKGGMPPPKHGTKEMTQEMMNTISNKGHSDEAIDFAINRHHGLRLEIAYQAKGVPGVPGEGGSLETQEETSW